MYRATESWWPVVRTTGIRQAPNLEDTEPHHHRFAMFGDSLRRVPLKREEEQDRDGLLQFLLDGPYQRLRDDNHVDADSILVWDRSRDPVMEAVPFLELLGRYPCGGPGSQWAPSDFTAILQEKRDLLRMSLASHTISDDDPEITPACGTVVLIVSTDPRRGHRWVRVTASIEAGQ